ncbi:hypothetical protein J437_LFUL018934 [Ladona fulva]|uniref:Uncharacterized protein n=1 Tax=Ladona fulva TaxID=123851 RepID=A0A8K0KR66_LADFU|nr:hypothetical protein J437_LFUL018934 [Ladona fulva]
MVENLTTENLSTHGKCYIPSKEELCSPLYEAREKVSTLRAVNDTAERAINFMQDFHGLITV